MYRIPTLGSDLTVLQWGLGICWKLLKWTICDVDKKITSHILFLFLLKKQNNKYYLFLFLWGCLREEKALEQKMVNYIYIFKITQFRLNQFITKIQEPGPFLHKQHRDSTTQYLLSTYSGVKTSEFFLITLRVSFIPSINVLHNSISSYCTIH